VCDQINEALSRRIAEEYPTLFGVQQEVESISEDSTKTIINRMINIPDDNIDKKRANLCTASTT
jgi:hypothetical protein